MTIRNTETAYGSVAKFFHWLMFILLAGMVTFGYLLADVPKPYQSATYNIHKLIGLTLLSLALLRLAWTLINTKPRSIEGTKPWERLAERTVHWALYATILAMPLAGWIGASAAGYAPFIGSYSFGLPIKENKELADYAFTLHGKLALLLIGLVSIHVLAALYHHFIKKDNVLRRMWSV
ncbi:MAG TPA: cytochrome b [Gammaproteobacteria bacterium]|jgi:cytochrome b561|nr:cytochrome b [Gammaproteobacteria bacterium]